MYDLPAMTPDENPPSQLEPGWYNLFDRKILQQLLLLDSSPKQEWVLRLMRAFEASISSIPPQLNIHRKADNVDGIKFVAHKLESTAAQVGCLTVVRLCAEIKNQLAADADKHPDALLDALTEESTRVSAALRKLLDTPPCF